MVSQSISIELQKREVVRKRLVDLRSEGIVPAVLHNHGKDSTLVSGSYADIVKVFSQAGKHNPVELTIDGKKHLANS
jgi:ribosomal protein L25 (general stress protein Ctc)